MKKKTKIILTLNDLRYELRNFPQSLKSKTNIIIDTITYLLENSIIVDKSQFAIHAQKVDYNLENDKNKPILVEYSLISNKKLTSSEIINGWSLNRTQEMIKEALLEAIEERVDEDEENS